MRVVDTAELSVVFDSVFDMTMVVDESETGFAAESGLVGGQWAHPLLGDVDAACDRVQDAANTAIWGLSDADLESAIDGCERLRAKVHHLELGLIAEADGRALGTRLGAASTVAWLRHRFRIRPGHAKSLVHTANAVGDPDAELVDYAANVSARSGRELVQTGRALAEGAISPEHAAIVDKIMTKVPREVGVEQAARAEEDLAGFCREFDPGTVAKLGDYMLEMMRTDTLDDEDEHRHRHRTLGLDEHTGGISGQLTRDGIATLRTALDPLAAPNPGADGTPDLRTPGQRLADALVELARRAIASDGFAANHGISHRVMVTIGLDSLTAGNGTDPDRADIDPDTARTGTDGPGQPADAGTGAGGPGQPAGEPGWASSTEASGAEPGDATTGRAPGELGEPAGGEPSTPAETTDASPPGLGGAVGGRAGEQAGDDAATSAAAAGQQARRAGVPVRWWADRPLPSWAAGSGGGIAPAHLEWGSLISASTALRMACHASVQRVLLDPAGAVLDVGRQRRTVTPAQYAALIARDGGCAFPGCTRPPAWCVAHHIIHWARGGPTDLANLVLLCSHHHRVIHHDGWQVRIDTTDRLPTFTPPRWIDPDQRPRRNSRLRAHSGGRSQNGRSSSP